MTGLCKRSTIKHKGQVSQLSEAPTSPPCRSCVTCALPCSRRTVWPVSALRRTSLPSRYTARAAESLDSSTSTWLPRVRRGGSPAAACCAAQAAAAGEHSAPGLHRRQLQREEKSLLIPSGSGAKPGRFLDFKKGWQRACQGRRELQPCFSKSCCRYRCFHAPKGPWHF